MSDIPEFDDSEAAGSAERDSGRTNTNDSTVADDDATEAPKQANQASDVNPNSNNTSPNKKAIGIALAIVAIAAIVLSGYVLLHHNWAPATCTEPERCTICRKTRGVALGHDWEAPTCTAPKTCARCGETEGDALGHDWEDATCTEPKTCSRCGETQGKALGHDVASWTVDKEPTCTEADKRHGTCTRCQQAVTEKMPKVEHAPGDWQAAEDVSLSMYGEIQPGTEIQCCTMCGEKLDSREYTIEVSTSQANANRQAMQGLRSMHLSHDGLIEELVEYEGFTKDEARFAADHCGADWNQQAADKAKDMMRHQGYSRSGLIDWLVTYELFTKEQAAYAADQVGL